MLTADVASTFLDYIHVGSIVRVKSSGSDHTNYAHKQEVDMGPDDEGLQHRQDYDPEEVGSD